MIDPGTPPGQPVFVAVGRMGCSIISCDDGLTWVADRSFDKEANKYVCFDTRAVRCFSTATGCTALWTSRDSSGQIVSECRETTDCDCDHNPGHGTGLAYGGGWFVATYGWGAQGPVRRSRDGINWETIFDDDGTYADVAFGQDSFMLARRSPKRIDDFGVTFQDLPSTDIQTPTGQNIWNVRNMAYAPVMGGRWVLTAQDGDNYDVRVSSDAGDSWTRPTTLPDGCGDGANGIAGGNGVIVVAHRSGYVCRSGDGGVTFSKHNFDTATHRPSSLLFADGTFHMWRLDYGSTATVRYTSSDGITWSNAETVPNNVKLDSVTRNPVTGTYVAVRGLWQSWYEDQRFYRSADGIHWDELPTGSYVGSHPINHIVFGYQPEGTTCPVE